jgi:hypothetical protein
MLQVYVVQVWLPYRSRTHLPLPWLYVGSSAHPPEHRLQQHRDGGRTATKMLRDAYFWRLRPELYDDLPFAWDRTDVVELEHDRAARLGLAGFTAWSDGVRHAVPANCVRPYDEGELVAVQEHVNHHVDSVVASARRPLSVDEIVTILRWDPEPDDPPPGEDPQRGRRAVSSR